MSARYTGGLVYNAPGGWSGYFDGTGDYLTTPTGQTALTLGTSDFTIEMWAYPTTQVRGNPSLFASDPGAGLANAILIQFGGTTGQTMLWVNNTNLTASATNNYIRLNQWNHIAVCRSGGNTYTFYINGVAVNSVATNSTSLTTSSWYIGYWTVADNAYTGYLSNFRIVKGTVVYTGAFTPPSGALLPITNTSLLTCAYPTFRDGSSNNFTITATGNTAVSNVNPFPTSQLPNPALGGAGNGVYTMSQYAALKAANLWPSYDPYYKNVVINLHGNGTNAAQNSAFLDSSGNNWTLTNTGAPYQGTLSPFSNNWSAYFVSSSTSYLSVASNAALNFGTGDFTIEYWFYRPAGSSTDLLVTNSADGTGNDNYFYLVATPTGAGFFGIRTNAGETNFTGTIAAGVNTWAHLAVSRQSGLVRMFMNGTLCGSLTMTGTLTQRSFAIGAFIYPGYSAYSNGYLSDVRLIKGTALYTSSFTAPTAPLTAVPGTVLLTCQSNRYVDNSVNNFTITRNGGATIQRYSPFTPSIPVPLSYSGYFDGSGDYITAPSNAAFDFGSGDFTIEMWVNPSSHPSETLPISRVYDGSGNYSFAAYFTSGTVKFLYNGLTTISTSTVLSLYTWSHIAYVRSGTTLTIYVNGVSAGSGTISGSITASSYAVGVGARYDGSFPFAGWISNARIVKGTAVYTSAFTVQNYPLTAISGTSLLTCQSTTFIDNSPNAFAITVAGNAQPIIQNPFGINSKPVQYSPDVMGGSGYFDQTTSFSTPNQTGFNFGTGDFTVEAWFYPTGTGNTYGNSVVGTADGSTGWSLLVNRTINGYGVAAPNTIGSAILLYTTSLLPPYQWAHVAWVRSGTTAKLFLNGALVSTATDTTNGNITNALWVGSQANNGTAQNFPGYIGDVRIVKGTALYTNSFVPPTAPLTAVSGTTFLCNMTNAGIFDNSMINNFGTVGNAQISTSIKKYGTASLYFDGSGDYITTLAGASNQFGSGDFTIEFWFYQNSRTAGEYDAVFRINSAGTGYSADMYMTIGAGVSGYALAVSNNARNGWAVLLNPTGGLPALSTWHHMAIVRYGSVWTIYLNGSSVGTASYSGYVNTPTGSFQIGWAGTSDSYWDGYIDDFRVTKGVARYTTNFTPPTSQLQDQ